MLAITIEYNIRHIIVASDLTNYNSYLRDIGMSIFFKSKF